MQENAGKDPSFLQFMRRDEECVVGRMMKMTVDGSRRKGRPKREKMRRR